MGGLGLSSSEVSLRVKCNKLANQDLMSKSDPFIVVYIHSNVRPQEGYVEVGRSEVVRDCLDPEFAKDFQLTYFFEEHQTVKIMVYDEDKKGSRNLADHDHIGDVTFTLGHLIAAQGQTMRLPIGTRGKSTMTVYCEELAMCSDFLRLQLRGSKLANKDGIFGKSDPYYIFSRVRENGQYVKVYQSEVVMDNLSPTWSRALLSIRQLCNGDYDVPLRLEIFDWDKNSSHDPMGSCQVNVRALLTPGATFEVIEAKKKAKSSYKNSGTITVVQAELFHEPSFIDYLKGGAQISLLVAIDFTGSNGDPQDPDSLHYIHPQGVPNQYQQAIMAVGPIVEAYDTDKQFPVWGFGGQPTPGAPVSHCFQLSGTLEVAGVQGILDAYAMALPYIRLSGPTLFGQVLSAAMAKAAGDQKACDAGVAPLVYNLLLILTDGVINDMPATQGLLKQAAGLPLSVIIVGVGGADFSQMVELDGDDAGPRRGGARDLVQFIPFRDYFHKGAAHLAKDTLAEVPQQFIDYCKARNILPSAPLAPPPTPNVYK